MAISSLLDAVNVGEFGARSIFERGHKHGLSVIDAVAHSHFQKLALRATEKRADAFDLGIKLWRGVELKAFRQDAFSDFVALVAVQELIKQLGVAGVVSVVKAAKLSEVF